jgi:hypothetical protein
MTWKLAWLLMVGLALSGCGRGLTDQEEYAQSVGDAMSSLDEASGSPGGSFTLREPRPLKGGGFSLLTEAHAASCVLNSFSSCSAGAKTRTFGGCTLGLGRTTLEGTVSLSFSQVGCTMGATSDTVTRTADFTLTGRRGATLTVSSPGGGQTVTRTATGFTYTVGGMKRVLRDSSGETLADIETRTLSAITLTGSTRATRVMDGGELEIKNLTRSTTLVLSPSQVTWSAACNCAVSGVFSGTTSGDQEKEFTLTLTGCGTATVESGGRSEDVTLDRCAGA